MVLQFEDKWIWDFWFAQDGADYHIFYLQAPRNLANENFRHWNASVGHAVSQDLRNWTVLPDALHPSDNSMDWDNYTTWTGSVIQHQGLWYMFYTGSMRQERGLIQRIGLATSPDLITWQKHVSNPLIEADPQWYELLDLGLWHDQAWRDPWVFWHQETGQFHALITGRVKDGNPDGRGVIAHARSEDLLNWEVCPPVTMPGEFGQMEVPQLLQIEGRYYLLFSTHEVHHSVKRRARPGHRAETGTHYLASEDPFGPYEYLTHDFLAGDEFGSLYSGKLVQGPGGAWLFMAFRNMDAQGNFIGEIIDPLPVNVNSDGTLAVVDKQETLS